MWFLLYYDMIRYTADIDSVLLSGQRRRRVTALSFFAWLMVHGGEHQRMSCEQDHGARRHGDPVNGDPGVLRARREWWAGGAIRAPCPLLITALADWKCGRCNGLEALCEEMPAQTPNKLLADGK